MRSYTLEALPTSNQKMHLYLGKAKVSDDYVKNQPHRSHNKFNKIILINLSNKVHKLRKPRSERT